MLTMDQAEYNVAASKLQECGGSEPAPTDGQGASAMSVPTPTGCQSGSVTLLVGSNFRARAGTENAIVGGGSAGKTFCIVTQGQDNDSMLWYQVKLQNGYGWIRSDLVSKS